MLIGYARVSTNDQDLTAQKNALTALGVSLEKTFTDQGLIGTNRARPGLREALADCRAGDTLVVTKLDRLARSLRDAKDIVNDLTKREVKLSIGGSVHDPPIRSAGSSLTCSPWSLNSRPTLSELALATGCRSPKRPVGCAANNRNYLRLRRST